MSFALRRAMSPEAFLTWVEGQEGRFEFDGFAPVAMVGGTNDHGTISRNLTTQLHTRLRGTRCRSMTSQGGGVATVGGAIRYPDATVTCSPVAGQARLMPQPVVVFEVLSPSTRQVDLVQKPVEYQGVPSLRRYVIVESSRAEARGYVRSVEGDWGPMSPLVAGEKLGLPEIGIVLPLDDIYEDVVFGDAAAGDQSG